jgi:CO/xanthine dehydrogenase Mo-binding subunit
MPVRVPGRATALPLRREGPAKLTGVALYTDDLVFPGAWYGATIRSTEPHARLDGIDLDDDFAWDTVVVVTAADIPGPNIVSLIDDDQPILVPVGGEIRHQAEPIALIAARDRATLREARKHVHPRTTRLEPVFDPLLSEHVFAHHELGVGDVDAAMAGADLVIEGEYRVGHQEQLYIENNATSVPRPDGGYRPRLAPVPVLHPQAMKGPLLLDDDGARVVQAETGGGFGGKEEYPSMLAPRRAPGGQERRPVRMITTAEDIAATTKRHLAIVRYRSKVAWTYPSPRHRHRHGRRRVPHAHAGRPVAGDDPCLGPYRCPAVRIRSLPGRRTRRPMAPPRLRGADRVRRRDAGEPHRRRARHSRRSRSASAGSTEGDTTPTDRSSASAAARRSSDGRGG